MWTADQLQVARDLVAIARKYADVPPLLMLAVCIQESSLSAGAVGDVSLGGSYGPFQLYTGAHPGAALLGSNPWYDFGYPEVRDRWRQTYASLGGDSAWAALGGRGTFLEQFAPAAQGSIAWSGGLGAVRYNDALSALEAVS